MELLLVAENVFEQRDANGNCVWNLARALAGQGHAVTLLSTARTPRQRRRTQQDGIRLAWLYTPWERTFAQCRGAEKLPLLLEKIFHRLFLLHTEPATLVQRPLLPLWRRAVRRAVQNGAFDAMLVCFFPREPAVACAQLLAGGAQLPPCWIYQLDAYAANPFLPAEHAAQRQALQRQVFGTAAGIFTTPLLARALQALLPPRAGRIVPLEFPLLTPPPAPGTAPPFFAADELACVYAGRLYEGLRGPERLLRLFAACKTPNVRLHLFVTNPLSEQEKADWAALAGGRAVFHPALPMQTMLAVLGQAGVLVNLGNAAANMLPSKLWDYIASGRPILHLAQLADCPAVPYLKKHPAALILPAAEPLEESAARLDAFLRRHAQDAALPFAAVQALYPEAVPAAVAAQITARLQDKNGLPAGPEKES